MRSSGDAVEVTLRPSRAVLRWAPALVAVPIASLDAAGFAFFAFLAFFGFLAAAGTRAAPMTPEASLVLVGCFIPLGLTAVSLVVLLRAVAWLTWIIAGAERVTIGPDRVEVVRSGLGLRASATLRHDERGLLDPRGRSAFREAFSLRLWLPRPATSGGIAFETLDGRTARFGIDLSRREAEAVVDAIADAQRCGDVDAPDL